MESFTSDAKINPHVDTEAWLLFRLNPVPKQHKLNQKGASHTRIRAYAWYNTGTTLLV